MNNLGDQLRKLEEGFVLQQTINGAAHSYDGGRGEGGASQYTQQHDFAVSNHLFMTPYTELANESTF